MVAAYTYDRRLVARRPLFDRSFYLPSEVRGTPPNVDTQGTDLDIWTYDVDRGGKVIPLAIAFQGKAAKPLWHHSFGNEDRRRQRIKDTIEARKKTLADKADTRQQRREFQHGLNVGDILYSSWGYDQTNVDFYEVTDVKGKQVILREIEKVVVEDRGSSEKVKANPGKYVGPPMRKTPSGTNRSNLSVKIDQSQTAFLWDGQPLHQTGWGWGH